jgi:multicomponent Na+:H+ antiporter subunit B
MNTLFSLILSSAAKLLFPLLLLFSIFLLLRGHHLPGGGFVGGIVAACAFLLYAMAEGTAHARKKLWLEPRVILSLGLLCAFLSSALAIFFGMDYFQALWSKPLPFLGKIGTPLFFDVGVYLVIFGASLLILFNLEETE